MLGGVALVGGLVTQPLLPFRKVKGSSPCKCCWPGCGGCWERLDSSEVNEDEEEDEEVAVELLFGFPRLFVIMLIVAPFVTLFINIHLNASFNCTNSLSLFSS